MMASGSSPPNPTPGGVALFRETLVMKPEAVQSTPTFLGPGGPFPQEFGRYLVRARQGGGGMGTVYLAQDRILDIDVALKVPHAHLMSQPGHLDRFLHEARAAARLDHPHFARICDINH